MSKCNRFQVEVDLWVLRSNSSLSSMLLNASFSAANAKELFTGHDVEISNICLRIINNEQADLLNITRFGKNVTKYAYFVTSHCPAYVGFTNRFSSIFIF